MSKEKKALTIDSLQEMMTKCSAGILTDYRGLSGPDITALRRQLRERDIGYRVVKNTLARLAAERAGKGGLVNLFLGPVAIAFGYEDITGPARALSDYLRSAKASLTIKGGFVGDRVLTAAEVATLATLPSKEVLLARVMGGLQAPMVALVSCLTAPMRGMVGILQARIEQLEVEQNVGK